MKAGFVANIEQMAQARDVPSFTAVLLQISSKMISDLGVNELKMCCISFI